MEHFMANRLDEQYQRLLQDIIEYGVDKKDRDWFPLTTTKKTRPSVYL
jgi:hypothetical protein